MSKHGVFQLARLTLNYCAHSGSSRGVRAFVAEHVEPLLQQYPHLPLETAVRPGKHPHALAEYVNGHSKSVDLKNLDAAEVAWHLDFLRTEKGFRTSIKMKRHLTSRPSIQGQWTPSGVVVTDG